MDHELEDIARWIVNAIQDKLSPGDERLFKKWLDASEKNREMYERVARGNEINARYALWKRIDEEKVLEQLLRRVEKKKRTRALYKWLPHVAAVIVAACAIPWIINRNAPDQQAAGEWRAELVLGNGEKIGIEKDKTGLWQVENAEVQLNDSILTYRATSDAPAGDNTLVVPKGTTFIVALSDGTRVHLNAASAIRYPVTFPGTERRVFLTGQAYFEVYKENDRPFIVETEHYAVHVTGTAFDVRAYPDEDKTETTLCNGSVTVLFPDGEGHELCPGEQLIFRASTGNAEVKEVNTTIATAWMDDNFYFYNNTLEEIFTELQRWFPVDVEFVNESKRDQTFSGKFPRFKEMATIVNVMRKAGIDIVQEGESIRVK
ncbi:MAG: FecR domain-containing protein [Odoribacteraceae bacterium]|jgi:ferric-dicitrate binding protein FerR (iron transport regulator)|nr:FecR domain-containing protein [Odoribacteraceae bacterium]